MSDMVVFKGSERLAVGGRNDMVLAARAALAADPTARILAFDAITSRLVELDLRADAPLSFAPPLPAKPEPRGRGRPKLGVEAREVTLLPRHWEWLSSQRAGASATLRRLVEDARRADAKAGTMREGKESLYRFITAMAGDEPGYEEAVRALFVGDDVRFGTETAKWPADVRTHAQGLLDAALGLSSSPLDAIVPKDRLSDVKRVLETALPGREVEDAERMSMGLSGAGVFKVVARGTPYLLRLDNPTGPFSDPARQYAAQASAAEAGVAPALLHADVEARISLSRFVEGSSWPDDRTQMINSLGAAVRRLHDTPLFGESLPWFNALDFIFGTVEQAGWLPRETFEPAMASFNRFKAAYPAPDMVSTHHDLNPGNVLFTTNSVVFVDWETASRADRYVDVAGVTNWFAANEEEAARLLAAYLGHEPDATEKARAWLVRQVNRLFYGSMLLMTAARSQSDFKVEAATFAHIPPFSTIRHEMASLATSAGQARLGCALFKDGAEAMSGLAFETALKQVEA